MTGTRSVPGCVKTACVRSAGVCVDGCRQVCRLNSLLVTGERCLGEI